MADSTDADGAAPVPSGVRFGLLAGRFVVTAEFDAADADIASLFEQELFPPAPAAAGMAK